MRLMAISDLHADFRENWLLLERVPESSYKDDILLVAGDIADRVETIERTLRLLRSRFGTVFFTPGNHELWVRNERQDSVEKLFRILKLCDNLGIQTKPARIDTVWIVPLFSWYDPEFGAEATDEDLEGWADFQFCRWPKGMREEFEHILDLNLPNLKSYDAPVISFSHFLPRPELLPPTGMLRFKGLPKVAGCHVLERQIRELKSITHVFGHSHINRDCVIDGIRYVQNALSYPKERRSDKLVFKEIHEFQRG